MINISEATAIAIHAMIYMANRKDEVHSLKEIAGRFGISSNHLSKVLQQLVKNKYLISIKGPKGGFRINEGRENSTLLEIYETIEGKYIPKNCLFASKHLTGCCCIMKPLITSMNNTFIEFMTNNRINTMKL